MLVLAALVMVPLVSLLALTLEGGAIMAERRRAQAIADAAALSAACDLSNNYGTNAGLDPNHTAQASALLTANACGYSNDGTTSTVTVNVPPLSGNSVSKAGYAEVLVQYNQTRGFSGIFGSGTIPITARAVARGALQTFNTGLLALEPSNNGLNIAGGATLNVPSAGVVINSSNSQAFVISGGANITAGSIDIDGGYSATGSPTINGPITTGVSPTPDPLAYLPAVPTTGLTLQSGPSLNYGSYTINPGIYNGGLNINGSLTVTMNPGVYYMNGGGLTVSNAGSLTGNGVLIYNNPTSSSDQINLCGSGKLTITPMTTGPFAGISIYQNRSSNVTVSISNGSTNDTISGTIYAAGAQLNFAGSGGAQIGSQVIVNTVNISGGSNMKINWSNQTALGQVPVILTE